MSAFLDPLVELANTQHEGEGVRESEKEGESHAVRGKQLPVPVTGCCAASVGTLLSCQCVAAAG
jgi:hypothetical protein